MADAIIAQLESARGRIEEKFSEAGGFLQETLGKIDQQLEVLARLGKALDPQSVGSATQDLLATAQTLNAVPADLAVREKKLQNLRRHGGDLREHISGIHGLLRYLRAFAFNVKITAAGMGEQAQQFSSFSGEMGTRIDHGDKQMSEFSSCLQSLERHIDTALACELKLAAEANAMLPSVPQGLTQDATSIDKFHSRASSSASMVRALAQRVQMCILNALSALQIGDTVRQRIEHVQTGLAALAELEACSAAEAVAPELRQQLDSFVCAMLAAQLEDTADTFEAEAARMLDLISQMAADTHDLANALDFDRDGEDDGVLRSLEKSVAKALVLVNEMERAASQADELQVATSDAVDGLVARVHNLRQVKDDVQYMALNTSLRCVHIGEAGRPLQVVATELSAYAKHLDAAAKTTLTSVEALAQANSQGQESANAGTSSRTKLEAAVARLRQAADVVEQDISNAMTQGQQLAAKLGAAGQKLNFKGELVDVIRDAAAMLTERAGNAPSDVSGIEPDLHQSLGQIMAGIAKSYTMARERDVHEQFMPCDEGSPRAEASAEDEDAIEMFA